MQNRHMLLFSWGGGHVVVDYQGERGTVRPTHNSPSKPIGRDPARHVLPGTDAAIVTSTCRALVL